MEVRCMICHGRGTCDHATWEMDEDGMQMTALDIEDCPDFILDNDNISLVVGQEVLLLDKDLYDRVHVQFHLPDKLHVRIFLKKNILDDAAEINELREEVTEALESLIQETIETKDMIIQLDFAFESDSNPDVPNCLPADIDTKAFSKHPIEEAAQQDEGWEDDEDEDPTHQGDSPIDWGEE